MRTTFLRIVYNALPLRARVASFVRENHDTHCPFCGGGPEDVLHLYEHCPVVEAARKRCASFESALLAPLPTRLLLSMEGRATPEEVLQQKDPQRTSLRLFMFAIAVYHARAYLLRGAMDAPPADGPNELPRRGAPADQRAPPAHAHPAAPGTKTAIPSTAAEFRTLLITDTFYCNCKHHTALPEYVSDANPMLSLLPAGPAHARREAVWFRKLYDDVLLTEERAAAQQEQPQDQQARRSAGQRTKATNTGRRRRASSAGRPSV